MAPGGGDSTDDVVVGGFSPVTEGLDLTSVDPRDGLRGEEAAARLAQDGPNVLPSARTPPAWWRLATQMVHFFALMLWVAGLLALVAGLPQLGVAIFVVIVVNGIFAFAQEQRAERATQELRELLPAGVTVRRDGMPIRVAAAEVVVGDRVVLATGDRIPADLRLAEAHALSIDQSMLTGESVPASAGPGDEVHAGCFVVAGVGEGVVEATGARTRLAEIARLTAGVERPKSPLATELDRVVRTIAAVAVGVGTAFFAISLLVGSPADDGFLFAIGVTVALVPEGLLPTVTLSLAMGAQRMARRQALVRHLEAVETLGATTCICTDKTGTLTRNEMDVVAVWTPVGQVRVDGEGYGPTAELHGSPEAVEAAAHAASAARVCSQGRAVCRDGVWHAVGDPMEAAIDALAQRTGGGPWPDDLEVATRFPFDPVRRRESAVTDGALLVKGAPDSVLPRCHPADGASAAVEELASRGLRVLAVARRDGAGIEPGADPEVVERDLELLGLLGLQDPPRGHVGAALATCRGAGVQVIMVTGDHPATARAIAAQVGLLGPEEIVLEGADLPPDDAALGALIDHDGVVISRVTPEDKLRITTALQRRGHVVAMTGDGVNDAPALREADIGVAMGRSGTDVAREAADLVLLDDDFASIVAAVEQGRSTFTNIRRFLTYHLTDNVAELTPFVVWALSAGRFPLALGVLQILCLDIGTDLLPALALGGEPAGEDTMTRPPERRHLIDGALLRRVFGVLGPAEAMVEMLAFTVGLLAAGWRPGEDFPTGHALMAASGAAFSAVVFGQMANAYACRSARRPAYRIPLGTNRLLGWAVASSGLALVAFLVIGPIARLLEHAPPPVPALLVALCRGPGGDRGRCRPQGRPGAPTPTTSGRSGRRCGRRGRPAARGDVDHGHAVHPIGRQVDEGPVDRAEGVADDRRPERDLLGQGEELGAVGPGVGGDAGDRPLVEEVRGVVEGRDVGEVDAGDGQGGPPIERTQRDRYQVADRSEEDRGVERFGWPAVGGSRRGAPEPEGQGPGRLRAGEHVHRRALVEGDLGGQVRGGAEAVDAEPSPLGQAGPAQGPVADDPGAEQRRGVVVGDRRRDAVGEALVDDGQLGEAAVGVPPGEGGRGAEVLPSLDGTNGIGRTSIAATGCRSARPPRAPGRAARWTPPCR